ncbi:MAG: alpha/beta fold hydrolase [Clostridiaceae bacterium]|jgi:pimeloyl-ACP methyl ester carboxylesterase|nr:alpha/beta fold hydrolase [Clostridiaceae bacterium]
MADIYLSNNNRSKKAKMRKIWIVLLALISLMAFILVAIAISSFVKASKLMEEEGSELSPFAANQLPDYSNVVFQTLDGQLNLRGWWINAQSEEALATIVLVHGQGMNRFPFGLDSVDLMDKLSSAGTDVLTFDLRSSAESDGTMASFGYMESDDVLAALAYVEAQAPDRPIVLYGIGSGTTAIFRAMLKLEEIYTPGENNAGTADSLLPRPERISALILDTPARSSDDFIAAIMADEQGPGHYFFPVTVPLAIRLSAGNKDKQDYLNYLSQLTIPVLLLGHETDSFLPEKAYLPLWTERVRIHPTLTQTFQAKGAGYLTAYPSESRGYAQAITDFISIWF